MQEPDGSCELEKPMCASALKFRTTHSSSRADKETLKVSNTFKLDFLLGSMEVGTDLFPHLGFFMFYKSITLCSILPSDLWKLFRLKIEEEEQSKKMNPLLLRT